MSGLFVNTSKMSNTDYRAIIKFFTLKRLSATKITKELADVYGDSALSYCTVTKRVAELIDPTKAFEDAPRSARPPTALTDESIRTVEEVVMCERQIPVRHIADKLAISKTSLYETIIDYVTMKRVCVRCVLKLLTSIQRTSRVHCCEELLENYNQDPTEIFGSLVTGDETRIHYCNPRSQQEAKTWQKPGEKTPTRLRDTRSAGKIIITTFSDCEDVLLIDFLPHGTANNNPYDTSLFHRLHSSIRGKGREKLRHRLPLLHDKASPHKSNITQAAIQYIGFTESTHCGYSPDLTPSDDHLFSNLKNFLRVRNFESDEVKR